MFYECASFYWDRANNMNITLGPAEICLAVSRTGDTTESWLKFKDGRFVPHTEAPTPIIRATKQLANCGFDPTNHSIDTSLATCKDPRSESISMTNYGVGHPGAIISSDQRKIHLYFYDSINDENGRWPPVARRWTTTDGFTFPDEEKTKTNHPGWSNVKRAENGHPNGGPLFLSFGIFEGNTYFAYSSDGLNFIKPDFPNPQSEFFIGTNQRNRCAAPGKPGLLTDARGWLTVAPKEEGKNHSFSASLFQGEGFLSAADGGHRLNCHSPLEDNSRGSTWAIWQIPLYFEWAIHQR